MAKSDWERRLPLKEDDRGDQVKRRNLPELQGLEMESYSDRLSFAAGLISVGNLVPMISL
jgi:hypothetical protein